MPADDGVPMSTAAAGAEAGYSVQQVRDLEALGVIPVAPRSSSGYRRFSEEHVRHLRAYRHLANSAGPVVARRVMRDLRRLPRAQAVALISGLHAGLNAEREHALSARRALESINDEAVTDAVPVDDDSMTITELSQALGVRASTLRFWEKAGLVAPERVATPAGTARRYTLPAIREARVTSALRAGGYRIPEVQAAITAIRDLGDTSNSLTALDARLDSIAQRTLALLRAGALLAEIIETASAV
ncbi:MerR family transcriptional regulator [Nocardia fluminea]|uniref:MerR family transcriptional regulator n=1 Tax=Nocardia fluminea TaxID=134984 RepID=UPI0033DDFF29